MMNRSILVLLLALFAYYVQASCVSFTVGQGTGCTWMCNYCSTQLGTDNYYFIDNVCTYNSTQGGCVGNPVAGQRYTCCSAAATPVADEL